jgi:hypothetical protein
MPALPFDADDRRIIGMGLIGFCVALLMLVGAALVLGLAVRVFVLAAGL